MARIAIFLFVLLAVSLVSAQEDKKAPPAAKVTITAELGCLHCDYGIGEGCVTCLKLDKKEPLLLPEKVGEKFHEHRFEKKFVVAEGTLSRDKDKRLILTEAKVSFHSPKDKKAPVQGTARFSGIPICGSCDLQVCEVCTLAVANGKHPIILDGKLATEYHAQEYKAVTTEGTLFVDKRGLVRLLATKVDIEKKEE